MGIYVFKWSLLRELLAARCREAPDSQAMISAATSFQTW